MRTWLNPKKKVISSQNKQQHSYYGTNKNQCFIFVHAKLNFWFFVCTEKNVLQVVPLESPSKSQFEIFMVMLITKLRQQTLVGLRNTLFPIKGQIYFKESGMIFWISCFFNEGAVLAKEIIITSSDLAHFKWLKAEFSMKFSEQNLQINAIKMICCASVEQLMCLLPIELSSTWYSDIYADM